MTTKQDTKNKPEKDDRPKLKKEKLKDLDAKGEGVRGGRAGTPSANRCTIVNTANDTNEGT